jgi:1-acyl-sn-glycerol-3-phosphate acyltransferase
MSRFCRFLLKSMGWKAMEPPVPDNKCIILGVPHTSAWDFIVSYLYYHSMGATAYIMIKKSFFWGPISPILKAMGGIPVDRGKGSSLVRQIIAEFNKREILHLAIAPEGTRTATANWKTGFHTIAKAADIPVYLGYFDWNKKEVGRGEKFELTDDPKADIKRIRQWYKDKGVAGKHRNNFITGDDLN